MPMMVLPEGLAPEDVVALSLIARERVRQRTVKGWTDAHDDEHSGGELTVAAAVYAVDAVIGDGNSVGLDGLRDALCLCSPCGHRPADPATHRAKAGALLVAELARGVRRRTSSASVSHRNGLGTIERITRTAVAAEESAAGLERLGKADLAASNRALAEELRGRAADLLG